MKKIFSIAVGVFILISPLLRAAEPNAQDVNKAFGIELFSDSDIRDDSPRKLAARLGFKFSATKSGDKSSVYCNDVGKNILGAKVEQFKFSFDKTGIENIDIIFFNKGDSMNDENAAKSSTASKMRKDAKTIESSLVGVLGEGKNSHFGSGKMRTPVKLWKFGEQKIMLEFKDREYVIVRIRIADDNGDSAEATREIVDRKKDFSKNVKTSANGDVYIDGIPMVDQGDKGYCTTAILEMCLRYYGIENIDMHKLADICETGAGGGTYISALAETFKKAAGAYRLKIVDAKLNMAQIKKFVDDGIPVCWSIHCTKEHVERMNKNSADRKNADAETWAKNVKRQKKISPSKSRDDGHTCLIIGYNSKTGEIGLCNSWGQRAALLWIRFDDAKIINISTFAIAPR